MREIFEGILQPKQAEYVASLLPARDAIASEMEAHARRDRVPIVDPEVGRFLAQIVRISGARRVLEVGTAIGYSTLHIARALPEGGEVVTIDVDPRRIAIARDYLTRAGVAQRVRFVQGKGLEEIPKVDTTRAAFDLAFLDAIKQEYRGYVEFALPKLRAGGVLVLDNLLWSGQVADRVVNEEDRDATLALREFNPWFVSHPALFAQILPLGDGTGLAIKRASDAPLPS